MNHRRKRTTRRENKRNSRKKLRGAEREAMNGYAPDTVALDWSHGNLNREIPVVNEEPRHRKVSQNKSPKKTRCTNGGTHTWVRSEEVTQEFYRETIIDCQQCLKLHSDWENKAKGYGSSDRYKGENPYASAIRWNYCRYHGPKVFYKVTRTYRACQKCGLKQHIDTDNERWSKYWNKRDLVLPRRQVKFY